MQLPPPLMDVFCGAGTIVMDLLADRAPNHVALFIRTAKEGGYDGTPVRWLATKEYFYNYNAAVVYKQQLEAI